MFAVYGWEAETDLDNDDDREGVHFLTIAQVEVDGSKGDEWAIVVHRTCDGKYPLDGAVAARKLNNAEFIVDALNKAVQDLGG
jgi:hypothetical protein